MAKKTAKKPARKKAAKAPEPTPAERFAAIPPERRSERAVESAYEVAAKSANPAASRAGVISEIEVNVEGISLAVIDGARAHLAVENPERPLTQADLLALRAAIDRAVQSTY